MDERTERFLDKAEQALDRGETDTADGYRYLAGTVSYLRRKEAKALNRMVNHAQMQ